MTKATGLAASSADGETSTGKGEGAGRDALGLAYVAYPSGGAF